MDYGSKISKSPIGAVAGTVPAHDEGILVGASGSRRPRHACNLRVASLRRPDPSGDGCDRDNRRPRCDPPKVGERRCHTLP
eukprot:98150-Amphidinium_carterae.3